MRDAEIPFEKDESAAAMGEEYGQLEDVWKQCAVLSGVAHDTRVRVIAPPTVIGILVPFVTMSSKRLRAATWKMACAGTSAISWPAGRSFDR